jgi:hypothetical protein
MINKTQKKELTTEDRCSMSAFLLGIAHGGITTILSTPHDQWYAKLLELNHKAIQRPIRKPYKQQFTNR